MRYGYSIYTQIELPLEEKTSGKIHSIIILSLNDLKVTYVITEANISNWQLGYALGLIVLRDKPRSRIGGTRTAS